MGRFFDGLVRWSIHHRHIVLLAAVAWVIAGVWSATRATFDVMPDFTPPRVVVQTEAPGMTTTDVEELVTNPLERVLLGTPEMTSVRSTSQPGLSVITVMFEDSVEIYRARQLVTERLQLASARLPAAVKAPQLAPISAPVGALLKFCLTSSSGDPAALRELRTFGDWVLRPRLLAISGIAQVTIHGGDVERVEVRPDPVRMRERGVALADLAAAVRGSQEIGGAGFVESGPTRLDVQTGARLTLRGAATTLEQTIVTTRAGVPVRIGDVAEVARGDEPRVGAAIYDGRPAVYVQVTKLPWGDTLDITRRTEQVLHELAAQLPAGAHIEPPVFRQADFVRTSIHSVGRAMAIGSILVIAILIAFLRHGRLALISLTAIPLSILGAAAVLVWAGATINTMTLGGLAIAVGEVVDDAIVDVENVWRRLRENAQVDQPRARLDVIHDASVEIRGSVVYATIIVCLVLVPVLVLGGISGRIFSPLAEAYILAIAASLAVALTVTPALCALLLPRLATREARPSRLARVLVERYRRIVRRIVEYPRLVFGVSTLLAVAAAAALPFLGGGFLPDFNERTLIAEIQAAPGASLDETVQLAKRADAQLRPEGAIHVSSRAGRAELDEDAAPVNRIELDAVIRPGDDREGDVIAFDLSKRLGRVPGIGFSIESFLTERIHEILSGETAPVVVKVVGPDLPTLRGLAGEVAAAMEQTSGLDTIRVEPQIDVAQLRVHPRDTALATYGVRPLEVMDDVVAWRQGTSATEILDPSGRVVDVVIAGPRAMRDRAMLPDLPVDTPAAGPVALSDLATIDDVAAPALVNHEMGERRISIGASASRGGLSNAVGQLADRLSAIRLPQGYRFVSAGEAIERGAAARRLLLVGGLILLGVFALLATAFSSVRDAGIVLLNFPLGLIGGVAGAVVTPEGLSVAGFVGFVTLFGIISRNGIMLVAHKLHLDAAHPEVDPVERVLRAAEERLIPILMTAVAAGLGLLPLALSVESAGSELEAPMAIVVCAGLVTSTALNMLLLPTVYVWLARRRKRDAS